MSPRKLTLYLLTGLGVLMLLYDLWAMRQGYQYTITYVVRNASRSSNFVPLMGGLTFGYWFGKSRCVGDSLDDQENGPLGTSQTLPCVAWPLLATTGWLGDSSPVAIYLVLGVILVVVLYNLHTAFDCHPDDSVGSIFVALIRKNPLIPYFMGMVSGHLWWT